jgi:hypothetical protein
MPPACVGGAFLTKGNLVMPQREEAGSRLRPFCERPAFGHGMIDSLPYLLTHNAGVSR